MLILAGLAALVTGGELACLLPKLWEKVEASVKIFARKYGFSKVEQSGCIYSSKPNSAQEHSWIRKSYLLSFLEASQSHCRPASARVSLWDFWAWLEIGFVCGHLALVVGRALGSCRLLPGACHRDIPKLWFASVAISNNSSALLVIPTPFYLDCAMKAACVWKFSFQPWKKSGLCFQHNTCPRGHGLL